MKSALITGISGQDGSYLAELLLEKGYEVHGLVRNVALEDPERRLSRLLPFLDRLTLHTASLESYPSLFAVFREISPIECYHLAAQSYVSYRFDDEFATMSTNIGGTHNVLSCIKEASPDCRFYFAGSSEMFGDVCASPQNESTPFRPRSIYGISKVAGYQLTENYRRAYDLFAASGILFNHESPRRGFEFVTRKITSNVAKVKRGIIQSFSLGNLDSRRDWGHSRDYVEAMWLMLQQPEPSDYVVATGTTHSVRDFVERAFEIAGLPMDSHVGVDQRMYRPSETVELCGDASKAERELGWSPKTGFDDLVREMMETDLQLLDAD